MCQYVWSTKLFDNNTLTSLWLQLASFWCFYNQPLNSLAEWSCRCKTFTRTLDRTNLHLVFCNYLVFGWDEKNGSREREESIWKHHSQETEKGGVRRAKKQKNKTKTTQKNHETEVPGPISNNTDGTTRICSKGCKVSSLRNRMWLWISSSDKYDDERLREFCVTRAYIFPAHSWLKTG